MVYFGEFLNTYLKLAVKHCYQTAGQFQEINLVENAKNQKRHFE